MEPNTTTKSPLAASNALFEQEDHSNNTQTPGFINTESSGSTEHFPTPPEVEPMVLAETPDNPEAGEPAASIPCAIDLSGAPAPVGENVDEVSDEETRAAAADRYFHRRGWKRKWKRSTPQCSCGVPKQFCHLHIRREDKIKRVKKAREAGTPNARYQLEHCARWYRMRQPPADANPDVPALVLHTPQGDSYWLDEHPYHLYESSEEDW